MLFSPRIKKWMATAVCAAFMQSFILPQPVQGITELAARHQERMSRFILPPGLGRIVDSRDAGSSSLVILIQDLHCNPEVQQNIVRIIDTLSNQRRIDRVFAEGAPAGLVDLSLLTSLPEPAIRELTFNELLRSGVMGAAEYYGATRTDIPLYGLEDWNIHRDNHRRLQSLLERQEYFRHTVTVLQRKIAALKERELSVMTRRCGQFLQDGRSGGISPERYYSRLERLGRKTGIPVADYPELARYIESLSLTRNVRPERLQREMEGFLTYLRSALPYSEYGVLMSKAGDPNRQSEFFMALAEASRLAGPDNGRRFPELERLFDQVTLSASINPILFIEEEKAFSRDVLAAYSGRLVDRETIFLSDMAERLGNMIALNSTAADAAYVAAQFPKFKGLLGKYFNPTETGALLESIDTKELFRYYEINHDRDAIFAHSIAAAIDPVKISSRPSEAVMPPLLSRLAGFSDVNVAVAGGFHQGLTALLQQKGISYVTIVPNVTSSANDRVYERIIAEKLDIESLRAQAFGPALIALGASEKLVEMLLYGWACQALAGNLGAAVVETELKTFCREQGIDVTLSARHVHGGYEIILNGRTCTLTAKELSALAQRQKEQPVPRQSWPGGIMRTVTKSVVFIMTMIATFMTTCGSVCAATFIERATSRGLETIAVTEDGDWVWKIARQYLERNGMSADIHQVGNQAAVSIQSTPGLAAHPDLIHPGDEIVMSITKLPAGNAAQPPIAASPALSPSITSPPSLTQLPSPTSHPAVTSPPLSASGGHQQNIFDTIGATVQNIAHDTGSALQYFGAHNGWHYVAAALLILTVIIVAVRHARKHHRSESSAPAPAARSLSVAQVIGSSVRMAVFAGLPALAALFWVDTGSLSALMTGLSLLKLGIQTGLLAAVVSIIRLINASHQGDKPLSPTGPDIATEPSSTPSELMLADEVRRLKAVPDGVMPDMVVVLTGNDPAQEAFLRSTLAMRPDTLVSLPFAFVGNRNTGNMWTLNALEQYYATPEFEEFKRSHGLEGRAISEMNIVVLNVNGIDSSILSRPLPLEIAGKKVTPVELALYNGILATRRFQQNGCGAQVVMDPRFAQIGIPEAYNGDACSAGITALGAMVSYEQIKEQQLPLALTYEKSGRLQKVYVDFDDEQISDDLEKNQLDRHYSLSPNDMKIKQMVTFGNYVMRQPDSPAGRAYARYKEVIGAYVDEMYRDRAPPPELDAITHYLTPLVMEMNDEDSLAFGVKLAESFAAADDRDYYRDSILKLFDSIKQNRRLLEQFECSAAVAPVSLFTSVCAPGEETPQYREIEARIAAAELRATRSDTGQSSVAGYRRSPAQLVKPLRQVAGALLDSAWLRVNWLCAQYTALMRRLKAVAARVASLVIPSLRRPLTFDPEESAADTRSISAADKAGLLLDDWEQLLASEGDTPGHAAVCKMLLCAQKIMMITRLSADTVFGDDANQITRIYRRFATLAEHTADSCERFSDTAGIALFRDQFLLISLYGVEYVHALDFSMNLEVLSGYRYTDKDWIERFPTIKLAIMRSNRQVFGLEQGFKDAKEGLHCQISRVVDVGNRVFSQGEGDRYSLYNFGELVRSIDSRVRALEFKTAVKRPFIDEGSVIRKGLGRFATIALTLKAIVTSGITLFGLIQVSVLSSGTTTLNQSIVQALAGTSSAYLHVSAAITAVFAAMGVVNPGMNAIASIVAYLFITVVFPLSVGIGMSIFLHKVFIRRGMKNTFYTEWGERNNRRFSASGMLAPVIARLGEGYQWKAGSETADRNDDIIRGRRKNEYDAAQERLDQWEAILNSGAFSRSELESVRVRALEVIRITPLSQGTVLHNLSRAFSVYTRFSDLCRRTAVMVDHFDGETALSAAADIEAFEDIYRYGYEYLRSLNYVYNITSLSGYRISRQYKWFSILETLPIMNIVRLPFFIAPGVVASRMILIHSKLAAVARLGNHLIDGSFYDLGRLRSGMSAFVEQKQNPEYFERGMWSHWPVSRMLRRLSSIIVFFVSPLLLGVFTANVLTRSFIWGVGISMGLQGINILYGFISPDYFKLKFRQLSSLLTSRRREGSQHVSDAALYRNYRELNDVMKNGTPPDRIYVMCGADPAKRKALREFFTGHMPGIAAGVPVEFIGSPAEGGAVTFYDGLAHLTRERINDIPGDRKRIVILNVDGLDVDFLTRSRVPVRIGRRLVTPIELALCNGIRSIQRSSNALEIAVATPDGVLLGDMKPASIPAGKTVSIAMRGALLNERQMIDMDLPFMHVDSRSGMIRMYRTIGNMRNKLARKRINETYNTANPGLTQYKGYTGYLSISVSDLEQFQRFRGILVGARDIVRKLSSVNGATDVSMYGLIPLTNAINGDDPLALWPKLIARAPEYERTGAGGTLWDRAWQLCRYYQDHQDDLSQVSVTEFIETPEEVFACRRPGADGSIYQQAMERLGRVCTTLDEVARLSEVQEARRRRADERAESKRSALEDLRAQGLIDWQGDVIPARFLGMSIKTLAERGRIMKDASGGKPVTPATARLKNADEVSVWLQKRALKEYAASVRSAPAAFRKQVIVYAGVPDAAMNDELGFLSAAGLNGLGISLEADSGEATTLAVRVLVPVCGTDILASVTVKKLPDAPAGIVGLSVLSPHFQQTPRAGELAAAISDTADVSTTTEAIRRLFYGRGALALLQEAAGGQQGLRESLSSVGIQLPENFRVSVIHARGAAGAAVFPRLIEDDFHDDAALNRAVFTFEAVGADTASGSLAIPFALAQETRLDPELTRYAVIDRHNFEMVSAVVAQSDSVFARHGIRMTNTLSVPADHLGALARKTRLWQTWYDLRRMMTNTGSGSARRTGRGNAHQALNTLLAVRARLDTFAGLKSLANRAARSDIGTIIIERPLLMIGTDIDGIARPVTAMCPDPFMTDLSAIATDMKKAGYAVSVPAIRRLTGEAGQPVDSMTHRQNAYAAALSLFTTVTSDATHENALDDFRGTVAWPYIEAEARTLAAWWKGEGMPENTEACAAAIAGSPETARLFEWWLCAAMRQFESMITHARNRGVTVIVRYPYGASEEPAKHSLSTAASFWCRQYGVSAIDFTGVPVDRSALRVITAARSAMRNVCADALAAVEISPAARDVRSLPRDIWRLVALDPNTAEEPVTQLAGIDGNTIVSIETGYDELTDRGRGCIRRLLESGKAGMIAVPVSDEVLSNKAADLLSGDQLARFMSGIPQIAGISGRNGYTEGYRRGRSRSTMTDTPVACGTQRETWVMTDGVHTFSASGPGIHAVSMLYRRLQSLDDRGESILRYHAARGDIYGLLLGHDGLFVRSGLNEDTAPGVWAAARACERRATMSHDLTDKLDAMRMLFGLIQGWREKAALDALAHAGRNTRGSTSPLSVLSQAAVSADIAGYWRSLMQWAGKSERRFLKEDIILWRESAGILAADAGGAWYRGESNTVWPLTGYGDLCRSLDGVFIVSGHVDAAVEMLRECVRLQDDFGRIPDRIDAKGTPVFEYADTSLWFIEAVYRLYEHTRDDGFMREMYPALIKALKSVHPDSNGLAHAEKGSLWVSGKPSSGDPLDLQVLYCNACTVVSRAARRLGNNRDARTHDKKCSASLRAIRGTYFSDGIAMPVDSSGAPDRDQLSSAMLFLSLSGMETLRQGIAGREESIIAEAGKLLKTSYGLRSNGVVRPALLPLYFRALRAMRASTAASVAREMHGTLNNLAAWAISESRLSSTFEDDEAGSALSPIPDPVAAAAVLECLYQLADENVPENLEQITPDPDDAPDVREVRSIQVSG